MTQLRTKAAAEDVTSFWRRIAQGGVAVVSAAFEVQGDAT